jgi:hypothetical protein
MGRESVAQISYLGRTGLSRLMLEGPEIWCWGEIRARLLSADLTAVTATDDELILTTP